MHQSHLDLSIATFEIAIATSEWVLQLQSRESKKEGEESLQGCESLVKRSVETQRQIISSKW